jgi:hypothetical protein
MRTREIIIYNMTCLKHNYRPVNNRYKNGKRVIEGGEWITEIRCEICDKKFEEPRWKKKLIKK